MLRVSCIQHSSIIFPVSFHINEIEFIYERKQYFNLRGEVGGF